MNLPKPTSMKYDELIIAVENGKMKIPQFQRDFVWTKNKSADLLDSIIKGYPIGTVYCKIKVPKVAEQKWTLLQVHFGHNCKALYHDSMERCCA
jgi:uncharacterized protein with ParB-like and HNH nuclease domain